MSTRQQKPAQTFCPQGKRWRYLHCHCFEQKLCTNTWTKICSCLGYRLVTTYYRHWNLISLYSIVGICVTTPKKKDAKKFWAACTFHKQKVNRVARSGYRHPMWEAEDGPMMRRSGQVLGWVFHVKNQRFTFSFDLWFGRSDRILVSHFSAVWFSDESSSNLFFGLQIGALAFAPGKLGCGCQWVGG